MKAGSFILKSIGLVTVLAALTGVIVLALAGYWLTSDDEPKKADAIVVLAGSYARPLYAADLYLEGHAPVVYLSDPPVTENTLLLRRAGVDMPRHSEVYRRLLIDKGVPGQAIRVYGENVISTAEEAEALGKILGRGPVSILLVTSPVHVRRAKLVFERALPKAEIYTLATPYENFPRNWWSDRGAAIDVVLECIKFVHYLAGGRFRYEEPAGPEPARMDTPSGG